MPYSLEVVQSKVFRNCIALEGLALGPTLRTLYGGAFMGCTRLKELYLFSWNVSIFVYDSDELTEEAMLPFGNPESVVIYGIVGSGVQEKAEKYGHEFRDINEITS